MLNEIFSMKCGCNEIGSFSNKTYITIIKNVLIFYNIPRPNYFLVCLFNLSMKNLQEH
jgi:hypothetical protein